MVIIKVSRVTHQTPIMVDRIIHVVICVLSLKISTFFDGCVRGMTKSVVSPLRIVRHEVWFLRTS